MPPSPSAAAAPLTDLRAFCAALRSGRYKASLLLMPDLHRLRDEAAAIATAVGATHLDVLDRFQADPAFLARLGTFSFDDLLHLLAAEPPTTTAADAPPPLFIVSGIEFLLAVWLCQGVALNAVKRKLYDRLELWDRRPAFLLVIPHDPFFASLHSQRRRADNPVVLDFTRTVALP